MSWSWKKPRGLNDWDFGHKMAGWSDHSKQLEDESGRDPSEDDGQDLPVNGVILIVREYS